MWVFHLVERGDFVTLDTPKLCLKSIKMKKDDIKYFKKSISQVKAMLFLEDVKHIAGQLNFTVNCQSELGLHTGVAATAIPYDYCEIRGFAVRIEYLRPDLVTSEQVIERFAEILIKSEEKWNAHIEKILSDEK